jgi:hypothetical protein
MSGCARASTTPRLRIAYVHSAYVIEYADTQSMAGARATSAIRRGGRPSAPARCAFDPGVCRPCERCGWAAARRARPRSAGTGATRLLEQARKRHRVGRRLQPVVPVAVTAGLIRREPGEHGGARRRASRRHTVCVAKHEPATRQFVQVRRVRVGNPCGPIHGFRSSMDTIRMLGRPVLWPRRGALAHDHRGLATAPTAAAAPPMSRSRRFIQHEWPVDVASQCGKVTLFAWS